MRILKTLLVTIMLTAISKSALSAQIYDDDLSPEIIPNLKVVIWDGADNGCWTNLGEAKNYAADKLTELGYSIDDEALNFFTIVVHSTRVNNGGCYGKVDIELASYTLHEDLAGLFVHAIEGGIFTGHKNANLMVLDYIKKLTDAMGEKQRN
ncbi:hypothetical protein F9L33_14575 [Amylibacter sp. SFDW26]|uniref:hypothetical protein n=1 Tax=Amylibacter sp. SFDW26 TaxID=2652722 RepID=UPI0012627CC1|nr:hypothetical protein [Amylibacter sp. SFDW26]KAB7610119.1 hypothetical protein F9L33_14575 [Amylibacter sp. SFDW26]